MIVRLDRLHQRVRYAREVMADSKYIIKTYKYRLYPSDEQAKMLKQWFAAIRWVYNAALEQRNIYGRKLGTDYAGRYSVFTAKRQAREIVYGNQQDGRTGLKNDPDLNWITEVPRHCLDEALFALNKSFDNFFKGKSGYPSPKTSVLNNSAHLKIFDRSSKNSRVNVLFGKDTVKIPKLGRVSYKKHKKFYGEPRNAEVILEGNEYYICLSTRHPYTKINHDGGSVGIDLGVSFPIATSDGEVLPANVNLKNSNERFKKLQRKFSRQNNKSSNRRKRVKFELAQIKRKQTRARKSYLHKATTELTKRYSYIAIENLKVASMTASAKGDAENHGRMVKQKAGLNREILNAAPHMTRSMLEYKAEWYGSHVEAVDPKHTSQACAECGVVDKENRKKQAEFKCVSCGHEDNADINAAKNILIKSGVSESVAGLRKTPSEYREISATSKSIVSCFQPLSNLYSSVNVASSAVA